MSAQNNNEYKAAVFMRNISQHKYALRGERYALSELTVISNGRDGKEVANNNPSPPPPQKKGSRIVRSTERIQENYRGSMEIIHSCHELVKNIN